MQTKKKEKTNAVYESYLNLKKNNPKIREREAAKELGITEAELVASKVGGEAILLKDEFQEILLDMHKLGEVLAITRNDDVVHERKGIYNNVSFPEPRAHNIGLAVNADIDLRLFMGSWEYVFAVKEGERRSIQFFNSYGDAVHKIYLSDNSNKPEYYNLIEKFAAEQQLDTISIKQRPEKKPALADAAIDLPNLRKEWEALKDTHDFYIMLRKYKAEREQALRIIGKDLAYQVSPKAIRQVLELARDKKCEIMVFVGNPGCIQIHTGPVEKLMEYGKWYNVLDEKFNLHINEENINSAWVVKKPSEDGVITSVEFFDKAGELLVTFFGKRKPGLPELALWREVVSEISPA